MEFWKFIEGYKSRYGRYRVSNLGRIKNGQGKLVSIRTRKKGYKCIRITNSEGQEKNPALHRIVAIAFIPNPDQLPQVNHLDGDKSNNKVSNLQWCTNAVNMAHAAKMGFKKQKSGGQNKCSALTDDQARFIRHYPLSQNGFGANSEVTQAGLAKYFGVTVHVIRDVRSGRSYPNA